MLAILSTLNPPLQEPLGPLPYPPICWLRAPNLTREQKRDCWLLQLIGWSYS
jgi:hypothetical protein